MRPAPDRSPVFPKGPERGSDADLRKRMRETASYLLEAAVLCTHGGSANSAGPTALAYVEAALKLKAALR